MRYERSGVETAPRAPWSTRTRHLVLGAAALVVAAGASTTALVVSRGPHHVVVIPAIARPYLEANVLLQNLGSPAPQGLDPTSWALRGDSMAGTAAHPRLAFPERTWVTSSGRLVPLTRTAGAAIVQNQERLAASIMAGRLLRDTVRQLTSVVTGELGSHPRISSPGGASIVTWYAITQHGNTATVDAAVQTWEQTDELVYTPNGLRLATSMNQAEVEGKATLVRVGGSWKVATLDQAPWQQAT